MYIPHHQLLDSPSGRTRNRDWNHHSTYQDILRMTRRCRNQLPAGRTHSPQRLEIVSHRTSIKHLQGHLHSVLGVRYLGWAVTAVASKSSVLADTNMFTSHDKTVDACQKPAARSDQTAAIYMFNICCYTIQTALSSRPCACMKQGSVETVFQTVTSFSHHVMRASHDR